MRKKLVILLSSVLFVGLIFLALPKPIIIGQLEDVDWDAVYKFVYEESSSSYEADEEDVGYSIVFGWWRGPHTWGCFRVNGVIHYVEPQRMDWIWTSDSRPWYHPWLIIAH